MGFAMMLRVTYVERPRFPTFVGKGCQIVSGYESVEALRKRWRAVAEYNHGIKVANIPGGVRISTLTGDDAGEVRDLTLAEGHFCERDNQGLCHSCGAEVAS